MTGSLLLFAVLLLGGTLLVSGVLKLRDLRATEEGVRAMDVVPAGLARPVSRMLPVAEVVLGVGLLLATGGLLLVVGALATALVLAFTVVVVRLHRREDTVACACFGAASAEPVSRFTVVRNVALVALAVVVVGLALPGRGVLPALTGGPAAALTAVLAAAAVAAVWALLGRVRALRARLDDALERLVEAEARPERADPTPIPDIEVVDAQGAARTLAALSAEKAQLLIGVSAGCSACHDLVPVLPQWRHALGAEVDVVLLANTERELAASAYADHSDVLYADPRGEAFEALQIGGTPAAVLLGTNGTVAAGPALGAEAILELVTAIVQAIGVNVMTGAAHQTTGPRPAGGEDHGSDHLPPAGFVATDALVRHEDGHEERLSAALAGLTPEEGDVAVVSWRNGCSYCGEIVEQMKFFSRSGDVVLLVNEPVATVRDQGIEGPVLQVVEGDASGSLGLMGTPSGYPVRDLRMLPGGGVGGGSVLRMLRERAVARGTLTEEQAQSPVFGGTAPHDHDHADHQHDHAAGDHEHDHVGASRG